MTEVPIAPYFVISLNSDAKLARIIRSSVTFESGATVTSAWRAVDAALRKINRHGWSLLVDLRQAPARNDPEFERAFRAVIPSVRDGFHRIGVLVRSAVGGLQVSRLGRADGVTEMISSNEEEVLAYFRAPDSQ